VENERYAPENLGDRTHTLNMYKSASTSICWARGSAVVEALRYKLEGHRIVPRWCHLNFSLI
jgi:hypothetical protein